MSEAKVRAMRETQLVEIDLNGPVLSMPPTDQRYYSINPYALNFCDDCEIGRDGAVMVVCAAHRDPKNMTARAVRALLNEVVQVAYSNALGRAEGQLWAVWRVHLDEIDEDPASATFQIPFGHVRWLDKHLADEKSIKVRAGLVQWREATVNYFATVRIKFDQIQELAPPPSVRALPSPTVAPVTVEL